MTTERTTEKRKRLTELSGAELEEMLGLIRGSDSVELKLTLPESGHRSAIDALRLDPLDAQIRQIFFFDTPDLQLQQAGLAVRARRVQGRSGDSVVKLRPIVPGDLPEDIRRSAAMNVEVDAMPGGYVCSASMKGKIPNEEVFEAVRGERPVRKVFSKEQRAFYAANAPEGLALDDLRILGPVFVLKLAVEPKKLGQEAGRRGVAAPRRVADPRAVDEVPACRGVPGGNGGARVPRGPWARSGGRSADEDEGDPRVLRRRAGRRGGFHAGLVGGLGETWLCRQAALCGRSAASSVAPIVRLTIGAPCVLAARAPIAPWRRATFRQALLAAFTTFSPNRPHLTAAGAATIPSR